MKQNNAIVLPLSNYFNAIKTELLSLFGKYGISINSGEKTLEKEVNRYIRKITIHYLAETLIDTNAKIVDNADDGINYRDTNADEWFYRLLTVLNVDPDTEILIDNEPEKIWFYLRDELYCILDDKIDLNILGEYQDFQGYYLAASNHHLILVKEYNVKQKNEDALRDKETIVIYERLRNRNERTQRLWKMIIEENARLDSEEADRKALERVMRQVPYQHIGISRFF